MTKRQQFIIIIGVMGVLLILMAGAMFFSSQIQKKNGTDRQEAFTASPEVPTPSPFVSVDPQKIFTTNGAGDVNTGVVTESQDAELSRQQRLALRATLPLTSSQFSLTYDKQNSVFVAVIKTPHSENRDAFLAWMKEKYPLISESDVVIQVTDK